jgi:hypothetical protein
VQGPRFFSKSSSVDTSSRSTWSQPFRATTLHPEVLRGAGAGAAREEREAGAGEGVEAAGAAAVGGGEAKRVLCCSRKSFRSCRSLRFMAWYCRGDVRERGGEERKKKRGRRERGMRGQVETRRGGPDVGCLQGLVPLHLAVSDCHNHAHFKRMVMFYAWLKQKRRLVTGM